MTGIDYKWGYINWHSLHEVKVRKFVITNHLQINWSFANSLSLWAGSLQEVVCITVTDQSVWLCQDWWPMINIPMLMPQ